MTKSKALKNINTQSTILEKEMEIWSFSLPAKLSLEGKKFQQ